MPAKDLKWSDARRILAVELHEEGMEVRDIMPIVKAAESTIYQWIQRAELEGKESLVRTYKPREPKLGHAQRDQLEAMLDEGPQAHGFEDARWTCSRVRDLIHSEFGVSYHISTVSTLLRDLGFSWQKPETRELRRDEEAIETWVRQTWPEVEKKAAEHEATIVFIDETGFKLSPSVEHTWARRGHTPVVKRSLRRDKLNVIGAVTNSGQFLSKTHEGNVKQTQIAQFLSHVLDWVAGPLIVVWDGARIHNVSNAVAKFMESSYGGRILECIKLPPYAPELNPVELAWRWLKSQGVGNRSPSSLKELKQLWRKARRKFKTQVDVLALIRHALGA